MPVVVLMGARQTGKSTLVRSPTVSDARPYVSLDSQSVLDLAEMDPEAFVLRTPRMTIDEVQHAPALMPAIKAAVDQDRPRRPGRFVLTGSANLLLMKQVGETLAGRAAYLTIWPLTRREQLGLGRAGIWSELLATPRAQWPELVASETVPFEDWKAIARRGGYPTPAHKLRTAAERAEWFEGYFSTYLQRDVPELSPIASMPDFRRLMRSVALRVGTLVNQTQLARDTTMAQSTVQRYLNLLETSYQIVRLAPYTASRTKRLIKTPKVYWTDTGLAMFIAGETEPRGEHLESLVLHDLMAWRDAQAPSPSVLYWRTTKGHEVDFVIEAERKLLPIEVKATPRPSSGDLANVRIFLDEYGQSAVGGLLLYTGSETYWIAKNVLAVPWWKVI
jgi:predicted AAA+ superfamily ATPase